MVLRGRCLLGGAAALLLAARGTAAAGVRGYAPPPLEELTKELVVSDELAYISDDEENNEVNVPGAAHAQSLAAVATASVDSDADGAAADLMSELDVPEGVAKEVPFSNLAAQQADQGSREAAIEGASQHSMLAAKEGSRLKRRLAQLRAQASLHDKVLRKLEGQRLDLEDNRKTLDARLRKVVAPRVALQARRVARQHRIMAKFAEEEARWEHTFGERRAGALTLLKERKVAAEAEQKAEEVAQKAEQDAATAKRHLEGVRDLASRSVEAVKYAKAHLQAKQSEAEDAMEETREAEQSLHRIQGILGAEEARVSKALESSAAKNARKVRVAQAKKDAVLHALDQTRAEYSQWKAQQQSETARVEHLKKEWATSQHNLDAARLSAADAAMGDVGKDAVKKSHVDLDDWAWSSEQEGDDN